MRLTRILRTASFRLALLYVLSSSASALLLGAVVFWIASSALNREMRMRITAETAALVSEFRAFGATRVIAAIRHREQGAGSLDYLLQGAGGTRLAGDLPGLAGPGWIDLSLGNREARGQAIEHGGQPERVRVLATALGNGMLLAVGDDLSRTNAAKTAILGAFASVTGLVLLLGILGGVLLSRAFLRRVDAIAVTAQAIIDGDLSQRIPVHGTGDDFDQLAATLNRMLDRIAALMESLRQVSSAIAHDLRTPLARLYQRLDTARTHAASAAEYRQAIDGAILETDEILGTFAALLRIAELEAGTRRSRFRPLDLSALVLSVAEAFAPAIEEATHTLVLDVAPGIRIAGDQQILAQMVSNLLENALRHTPAGATIRLGLERAGKAVRLVVADNGPGVPASERGRIFERFYRGEQSRTTPGSGLGLSLVRAAADLHEAVLSVDDACPGLSIGVTFQPSVSCPPAP